MKIVYSDPKSGKSGQVEVQVANTAAILNRKIGEVVDGTFCGLTGFKLKITGGSDKSGFPMDRSMEGTGKAKALTLVADSGTQKGQFTRKSKRGNMISADTEQVNVVIVEYGDKPLAELFPEGQKKPKEEKPAEEKKAKK